MSALRRPAALLACAARVGWRYLLRRPWGGGALRPLLASYKLTYRCNLRCAQCPFHALEGPTPTFAQVSATLAQLRRRGSRLVIFEGGEPMLWRDGAYTLHDVVAAAKKQFDVVGVTTNGTFPLDVPADVLWVSVDGLAETHNRLRGADIFDQVMDHLARSAHPRLYAHITANAVNYAEVPALVRWLRGRVRGVTVQFYYPYHARDELFLDFDRRAALLAELMALKRAGYPVLNSLDALAALQRNRWRCVEGLLDNADPDGRLAHGCYLRGRGDLDCARCGFAPHTELALAYQGHWRALRAGLEIFFA